jgi:hypothetical protein
MTSRVATIEPDGPATNAAAPERGGGMKFQYASGSRPLDGFIIKRGIGRGGFGEVYFATSDAGKELALKHIERNLEVELRGVSQCLNLKHPNLIDLYDIKYDDLGDAWVVMEYVAGASLKDTVDRNPNGLPLDQVHFWFCGIAAGVAYLHDHGIVHRDLKPGNIFEDGGFVKIGDYGLSKFISTSRRSGQTESVGTFHYMAPEIGKGVYGKEIDIYALGIVLYEMLTGRTPFDGESSQEIIMKHLTADPDLSGVQQPYRTIIQRALQKDPDKRFHNASEMVALLKAPSTPAAGSRQASALAGASVLAGSKLAPGVPDSDGIEFGPLQIHTEKAAPYAEVVRSDARAPLPMPMTVSEEPIAKAARDGLKNFGHWWNYGPLNTPLKIVVLIAAAIFAAMNGPALMVSAVVLGSLYIVYLGIRLLVMSASAPPTQPIPRQQDAFVARHPHSAARAVSWEQQGRLLLGEKTAGDHIGELTGSMLSAAVMSGILTFIMAAIGGDALMHSADRLAGPLWLWLMTTIGSWLVLFAGKACERTRGERMKRRFGMALLGLAFGAVAFVTSQYLMVNFGEGVGHVRGVPIARAMFEAGGAPKLAAFLAYFGAAFFTIGWWKQSDPLRSSRLRIAPILLTMLAAWVWWLVFAFPQPWGFMLVAAMSISTQLSAPWLSPAARAAALGRRQQLVT